MSNITNNRAKILLVAGMHRSGTSAVTRVLNLLGSELPQKLLDAAQDNPTGFWEPVDIVQIHDTALISLDSSWDDPCALPLSWFDSLQAKEYQEKIAAFLITNRTDNSLYIIKDPRTSRFIPLWLASLRNLHTEPYFIICYRHPDEVAASLRKRNGFSRTKSYMLWLRYTLESERNTRGYKRCFCGYNDLMIDWRESAKKISREFGIVWPRQTVATELQIDQFLTPELRHHAAEQEDTACISNPDWFIKVYSWLHNTAHGNPQPLEELDQIWQELSAFDSIYAPLHAENKLYTQQLLNAEKRNLEAKQAKLTQTQTALVQTQAVLAQSQAELVATRSEFAQAQAELVATQTELAQSRAELAQTQNELATVYSSRSWRVTKPLRAARRVLRFATNRNLRSRQRNPFSTWLKKPILVGQNVAQFVSRQGGFGRGTRKAYQIYRQYGLNTLYVRLRNAAKRLWIHSETVPTATVVASAHPRRILVADYRIPRPDVSAGELATAGILHDLCALGFEVVFIPENFLPDPHYERQLSKPGLSFITTASAYTSPADYLAREGHDFGMFYFFRIHVAETMLEIARMASPQARIIFHAPDLYSLRETREAWLEKDPVKAKQAKMTEEREMRIFGQSDLVVVVSPVEHQILQERLPQKKIAHFPVLYAPVSTEPTGYEKRKDMFFLGGYAHPPNVDAVLWFATEIWLLIREKLPDAMFHIIGAEAPEQLRRLGELPGIRYVGYVENLEEALATMRVGVAPLRYGAGIKGKVAATMGLGIPCVCTSIAAEGMYLHNGEQVLLADTPEDFANAVVQLYTDESLWQVISEKGRQHIDQHFGKKANTRKFISVFQQVHALPIDLYIRFCKKITPDTLPTFLHSDTPEVSIIIPVYNQWNFTRDCLHSVLTFCDCNQVSYEILLADDGSTDETMTASEKYPGVRVIKTKENCGFLRNCNNASKHAKGKYILLLNNDTIILPGWLEALYKTMEEDENIAVAGSKMLYPDGTIQEAGAVIFNDASGWNIGRGHQRYEEPFQVMRRVDYVSGCSMLIRSSVWKEVGGFDERYNNAYCEDSDFCFSARELGYSVVYQPESEIVHFENVSYGPEAGDKKTRLMRENCRIFLEKWNPVLQSGHVSPTPDWQMAMNHADMRQGVHVTKISSFQDYILHIDTHRRSNEVIEKFERSLIPAQCSNFTFNALCYICKSYSDFQVNGAPTPNWRESLLCATCHLNNRFRAFLHIFTQEFQPDAKAAIYVTEQTTPLYQVLKQSFPHLKASEYLGNSIEPGKHDKNGIRNEDLTGLSFSDSAFDYILSLDVFEHIPNYPKALSECYRCLKPGGTLLFTVPFVKSSEKNITRATIGNDGEILHILPAEYHGDPLSSNGCLCFHHFGWEILDDLRNAGFQDPCVLFYWSKEFAYLGGEQVLLSATKARMFQNAGYKEKLNQEIKQFKQMEKVHALPEIFHYWSKKYPESVIHEAGAFHS